jgi:outer membrane receptor protein involved in Fe transport
VDLFNASVAWMSENGMYKASLEARNITDESYIANGVQLASPTAPSITGYIGEPRVWMLRLGVTF